MLADGHVSVALFGEPVGSTMLAEFILGEQPAGMMLIGGVLILTDIVLASRTQADHNDLAASPLEPG